MVGYLEQAFQSSPAEGYQPRQSRYNQNNSTYQRRRPVYNDDSARREIGQFRQAGVQAEERVPERPKARTIFLPYNNPPPTPQSSSPALSEVDPEMLICEPVQQGSYVPWEPVKYTQPIEEEAEPTRQEMLETLAHMRRDRDRAVVKNVVKNVGDRTDDQHRPMAQTVVKNVGHRTNHQHLPMAQTRESDSPSHPQNTLASVHPDRLKLLQGWPLASPVPSDGHRQGPLVNNNPGWGARRGRMATSGLDDDIFVTNGGLLDRPSHNEGRNGRAYDERPRPPRLEYGLQYDEPQEGWKSAPENGKEFNQSSRATASPAIREKDSDDCYQDDHGGW